MTNLAENMRVMAIKPLSRGQGELVAEQFPVPSPREHEVLIRIAYAGVNRADILQRKGMYPPPEGASPIAGLEASGEVVAIGERVTEWKIGDAVCALLAGGGYAQYAVAHAQHCLPVPQGWSMKEAAAFPEAAFTIWMALGAEAALQSGESLLVHGGASGIGMTAIQYASALGAMVYTTASTPEKCAMAESWGATRAICYKSEDFVEVVMDATKHKGVHVILDFIGGDYVPRNLQCLATDGRMVSLAFLGGAKVESLHLAPLLQKRLTWKGTTLRARSDAQKATYASAICQHMWPFVLQNRLRPRVDCVFSLSEAQKAHEYMEQNLNIGKIVLQV
jgi:putative PIG3 family NAD(P)H quinone oxidoreductase